MKIRRKYSRLIFFVFMCLPAMNRFLSLTQSVCYAAGLAEGASETSAEGAVDTSAEGAVDTSVEGATETSVKVLRKRLWKDPRSLFRKRPEKEPSGPQSSVQLTFSFFFLLFFNQKYVPAWLSHAAGYGKAKPFAPPASPGQKAARLASSLLPTAEEPVLGKCAFHQPALWPKSFRFIANNFAMIQNQRKPMLLLPFFGVLFTTCVQTLTSETLRCQSKSFLPPKAIDMV